MNAVGIMRLVAIVFVGSMLVQSVAGAENEPKVRLFNGMNLNGWTPYIWDARAGEQDTTTPAENVWKVKDGVLVCAGRPVGYLKTTTEYQNYKLGLEWRWPEETERANSGILVHTTTPKALGLWPRSVEVQLYTNNAGDFWVIGTTLKVPDLENRRRGRRHLNLTNNSEKPIGQWNKIEVTCRGQEILVRVNGDLVNHATDCSVTKGAIALQSEGREVHFRNIFLTPLKE